MHAFPNEINVLLGRAGVQKIRQEEWGAFDLFRKLIIENNTDLAQTSGIRLARPFYERFVLHLLMFDDVFKDFEHLNSKNETGLHILNHIKSQLVGAQYQKLSSRDQAIHSNITIEKPIIQRLLARRAEANSIEGLLKQKYLKKQYESQGDNYLFQLKGEKEVLMMRDALTYAAMVEALQTSPKTASREIGDRLAKENFVRILIAHHILDSREGFRIKGETLDMVRKVLDALDRDSNGLLSLKKASDNLPEDISPQANPLLWQKIRSYDANGDGFLTSQEQIRLKEAIADLICNKKINFDLDGDNLISFEEVEKVLARELPTGN